MRLEHLPSGTALVLTPAIALALMQLILHDEPFAMDAQSETIQRFLTLLLDKRIITLLDDSCFSDAETAWESHDLYFHMRSRPSQLSGALGRRANPRRLSRKDAVRDPVERGLKLISLEDVAPPLWNATSGRRTLYEGASMTLADVSALLRLSLRVTGAAGRTVVPSGGNIHALNCYLTVEQCAGLPPGIYAFDPYTDTLLRKTGAVLSSDENAGIAQMMTDARTAMNGKGTPRILMTLTATIAAVTDRYSSLAYRLALLEAGATLQSVYLAAAAAGLAVCAIGASDSHLFARVSRTHPILEPSIAELAINGRIVEEV